MKWNLLDETKFSADEVYLPEMSIKPYFQYGIGFQKLFNDRYSGYLQAMVRSGGRNGFVFNGGLKVMLGR